MNEILKILLSLSLSGTLIYFVLWLCRPMYNNKFSRQWQYYIWLVVIARLLMPFSPDISLIGTVFYQIDNAVLKSEVMHPAQDETLSPMSNGTVNDRQIGSVGDTEQGGQLTPVMANIRGALIHLIRYAWLIWLFVAALLLIRKITVYQSFVKYIKAGRVEVSDIKIWERLGELVQQAGVKQAVSIYTNTLISSPLLIGFFRPCIMLPTTELSGAELDYTILHELTHFKRWDMFYKWLVQITICLHWFNPVVYILGREISRACELSCDEALIKELDQNEKYAYGNTLIEAMKTDGEYEGALASVTLNKSIELLKERLDAIMNYKKKSRVVLSLTLAMTAAICLGAASVGSYALPKQTNYYKADVIESNGVTTVPVNIPFINEGKYVWLGEYKLSAGDKIRYNIPAISGAGVAVGFIRSTELSPTYFTQINDMNQGMLNVIGEFDVPASLAGEYKLYIQACSGNLSDIKGTVEIGNITDVDNGVSENIITVPVSSAAVKDGVFMWLGEYSLSYGDKIHYNVSAEAGRGLQVGFAAPDDDPLNRSYYTVSNKRYDGVLEAVSDFTFSQPVPQGKYRLFIRGTDGEDLTNVKGNITIKKQSSPSIKLETVTLKNIPYHMIHTKEQLLALSTGQLSLDKEYMLQGDIDLSGTEWIPIGTPENPFTGSFNGNGCEIKNLTMTDPDARVIGLFGYADSAKIYNVTLRDYDIAAAGRHIKSKSVSPILVFGTDTKCYDNFTYPQK